MIRPSWRPRSGGRETRSVRPRLEAELDLWGMWDEADAYGWRTTDTGAAPLPVDAMETAATLSGLTTEHDNQDDHGLDH